MVLIRIITLEGLINNTQIKAKHIAGVSNVYSDLLSRLKYKQFRTTAKANKKYFKGQSAAIPHILTPMEKIWID